MQKPLNCNQDWSKMTPTEGGRICGSCEKLIVDFRKKSWKEIETKQSENNNSLCGVYSEKQLKHWGKEVPKSNFCSKSLLYASMILSMNTAVNELHGKTNFPLPTTKIVQTNQQKEQLKNEEQSNSDSLITISGQVIDEDTGEGLIGATVLIKDSKFGAATDIDGNFTIKDYNKNQQYSKNITLIVKYVGYSDLEITLTEQQKNHRNLILNNISMNSGSQLSVFYITVETTPWQRFKSRIRRIFRKESNFV